MSVTFINNTSAITAQMLAAVEQVVRNTAAEVVQSAQNAAPVDTSALRVSIHAVTDAGSDYAAAAAQAQSLRHSGNRPGSPAQIYPEVRPSRPLEAIVAVAVHHGAVNEFGSSKMAARPFFGPAFSGQEQNFVSDLLKALTP